MKYTRKISGIERLMTARDYPRGIKCYGFNNRIKKRRESEDTIIRKDIYKTIITMMEENKGSIEIEIFLSNKYPSYSTYIPKIISDLFKKHETKNNAKHKLKEDGEER